MDKTKDINLPSNNIVEETPMFYHCKLCQTSFPTIGRLKLHNSFHDEENSNESNASSNSRSVKNSNLWNDFIPVYTCRLCGASFADLEIFENHIQIHSGSLSATVQNAKCSKQRYENQDKNRDKNGRSKNSGNENFQNNCVLPERTLNQSCTAVLSQLTRVPHASDVGSIQNNSILECTPEKSHNSSILFDDTWQNTVFADLSQNYPPIYTDDILPATEDCLEVEEITQNRLLVDTGEIVQNNFGVMASEEISKLISDKNAQKVQRHVCNELPVHVLYDKPHECIKCGARFAREGGLQEHIRTHTGEKPYKCDFCAAAFVQKGNLQRHVRLHTRKKPFKCYYCRANFATQGSLQNHTRIHTGEKPYKCDKCDSAFTQLATLKKHLRVHVGVKTFKCTHCDAAFVDAWNLSEHLSSHSDKKPFLCNLCGDRFSTKRNLQYHSIVHSNEKNFKCPHCKEDFRHRTSLYKHIRSIHRTINK